MRWFIHKNNPSDFTVTICSLTKGSIEIWTGDHLNTSHVFAWSKDYGTCLVAVSCLCVSSASDDRYVFLHTDLYENKLVKTEQVTKTKYLNFFFFNRLDLLTYWNDYWYHILVIEMGWNITEVQISCNLDFYYYYFVMNF